MITAAWSLVQLHLLGIRITPEVRLHKSWKWYLEQITFILILLNTLFKNWSYFGQCQRLEIRFRKSITEEDYWLTWIYFHLVWCSLWLFSINRLYRPKEYEIYHTGPGTRKNTIVQQNNTINHKNHTLFGLGFMETIPTPWTGFLRSLLVNHLQILTI